jgi:hypothetical protein
MTVTGAAPRGAVRRPRPHVRVLAMTVVVRNGVCVAQVHSSVLPPLSTKSG